MAGTFMTGEVKVRPGSYFNIQKTGDNAITGAQDGIVAVIFKSDFGPLGAAVEISAEEGYEKTYGTELTTDAMGEVLAGGATKVIACRIGKGGTQSNAKLAGGTDSGDAVSITSKHAGAKMFSVTVREKLSDESKKECVIYTGTKEFEKVEFDAGENEVKALVQAFINSANFIVAPIADATGVIDIVSQKEFTAGTNPTITTQDYSDGFAAVEPYFFNTICVDTDDTAVHALLASYVDRIFNAGQLALGVVAEKKTVPITDRMNHAAAFNSEKMHYVVNAAVKKSSVSLDGYQTAARIAGMIAACPSNTSLTHTVIDGFTDMEEIMTSTMMAKAETMGCLVLSTNTNKQIWIDSAINTLVTPSDNQDDGWKKIRRTKTRYELITRANNQSDALVGKVDNDVNGRATIVSQVQGVVNAMIQEGKLVAGTVTESAVYKADGDAAWFDIQVIDKDSAEHIYLTYKFSFSTQQEV